VSARAKGHEPFSRTVKLAEGETTVPVEITLQKSAPAPPVASGTAPAPSPSTTTDPPPEAPRSSSRVLPIVTTAGAVLLAGVGVTTFLLAGSAQSDAERECPTRRDCDGEQTKVRTLDAVALGGFIGAVGLGALSIVLWASPSTSQASAKDARIVASPSWAGIQGAF
jgi:hypothetical protein